MGGTSTSVSCLPACLPAGLRPIGCVIAPPAGRLSTCALSKESAAATTAQAPKAHAAAPKAADGACCCSWQAAMPALRSSPSCLCYDVHSDPGKHGRQHSGRRQHPP